MNAEKTPSEMSGHYEMASYIIRQTETVNGNHKEKTKKNARKYLWSVGVVMLMLALSLGWYGVNNKAAAFEKEETEPSVAENVTKAADKVTAEVAEAAEATEPVADAEVTGQEEKIEQKITAGISIPSGDELLGYIAKQEVSAEYEENISGLLWNYELIADIQRRADDIRAEEELREEEYRELLVTMGMNEDYVSQDPELPEYLTKTYNPQMDIELSEQELSELLRLVEAEAPAEDIYGKILVANVVLNRVNNEKMADTVTGVIYEKVGGSAQFSPTVISWYWNSIVVTDSTREAVARCLSGEDYSEGALYFYAWERDPDKHERVEWMQDLECVFTHGGHRFFR